jgi:hypothetical protein
VRLRKVPSNRRAWQASHMLLRKLPQARWLSDTHMGGVSSRAGRMGRSGWKAINVAVLVLLKQGLLQYMRQHHRRY